MGRTRGKTKSTPGSGLHGAGPFSASRMGFHYRLLFDRNPVPMWVFDRGTLRFLAVNRAAVRQYGFTRREFLCMTIADIRPPETIPDLLEDVGRLSRGLQERTHWKHRRRNGEVFDVEIVCHPLDLRGRGAVLVAAFDITDRQRALEAAGQAEEKYRSIFENAVVGIFQCTLEGRPLSVNPAMAHMHGYDSPQQLLAEISNVATQLFIDPTRMMELHRAAADGIVRDAEVEVRRRDGSRRWMKVNVQTKRDAAGNPAGMEGTTEDITDHKRAEESLLFKTALLEAQSETTLDGIIAVDEAERIVLVNRQFARQFGIPDDLLASGDIRAVRKLALQRMEDPDTFTEKIRYLAAHPEAKSRDELHLKNGCIFDRYSAPLMDAAGNYRGRIWYHRDITESKRAEARIQFLAWYDPLTGLPNRTLLRDRMENALAAARRRADEVAVLVVDLDHFKFVNDSLGRAAGDNILQSIALRLRECVREQDTVARLDGDEFAIVLTGIHDPADAALTSARILARFAEPFHVQDQPVTAGCSLGISVFPDHAGDSDTLIRYADQAMQWAKKNGRSTFRFFTEELNTEAVDRLTLENDLRLALDRQELFLVYQPQVEIASGRITGFEALLRWQHPRLGLVSPDVFIPIAESCGLILPIGEWVLRTACSQVRAWQRAGLTTVPVAVNVSAVQFRHQNFCSLVRQILAETGLAAPWLQLEITESLLLASADVASAVLREFADMGVMLALDDFGTGYSSFSYLKQFRAGKLKIDRSFVRDLMSDRDDAAIVPVIIALGRILNMRVVAEGVENEAQLSFLREHGCDEIQGYYCSRPIPAKQAAALLLPAVPCGSGGPLVPEEAAC